jgi:hypothetical protein
MLLEIKEMIAPIKIVPGQFRFQRALTWIFHLVFLPTTGVGPLG